MTSEDLAAGCRPWSAGSVASRQLITWVGIFSQSGVRHHRARYAAAPVRTSPARSDCGRRSAHRFGLVGLSAMPAASDSGGCAETLPARRLLEHRAALQQAGRAGARISASPRRISRLSRPRRDRPGPGPGAVGPFPGPDRIAEVGGPRQPSAARHQHQRGTAAVRIPTSHAQSAGRTTLQPRVIAIASGGRSARPVDRRHREFVFARGRAATALSRSLTTARRVSRRRRARRRTPGAGSSLDASAPPRPACWPRSLRRSPAAHRPDQRPPAHANASGE